MVLVCGMPGHPRTEQVRAKVIEFENERLHADIDRLYAALVDAEKRLRGAGMLGGNDDPVCAALDTQR